MQKVFFSPTLSGLKWQLRYQHQFHREGWCLFCHVTICPFCHPTAPTVLSVSCGFFSIPRRSGELRKKLAHALLQRLREFTRFPHKPHVGPLRRRRREPRRIAFRVFKSPVCVFCGPLWLCLRAEDHAHAHLHFSLLHGRT